MCGPWAGDAVGVRGIRLRQGDYVVGAARAKVNHAVLAITENGYGKQTPVEDYRITNRGARHQELHGDGQDRPRGGASRWWTARRTCCW